MTFLQSLGNQSVFLLALAVFLGIVLGKIRFRGMALGSSGALFTGLAIGALGGDVPKPFFDWNLVIFVASVGLLAARDILRVLRWYGMKFIVLAVGVTRRGSSEYVASGISCGIPGSGNAGGSLCRGLYEFSRPGSGSGAFRGQPFRGGGIFRGLSLRGAGGGALRSRSAASFWYRSGAGTPGFGGPASFSRRGRFSGGGKSLPSPEPSLLCLLPRGRNCPGQNHPSFGAPRAFGSGNLRRYPAHGPFSRCPGTFRSLRFSFRRELS